MKSLILGPIIILCLFVVAQQALACSCELPVKGQTIEQQINEAKNEAEAVFTGEVLSVTEVSELTLSVRLRVKVRWKGIHTSEATVLTGIGSGDCGFPFVADSSYLIYADRSREGELSTNICHRTKDEAAAESEIAILNEID
jgi:hypothetical protein